MFTIKDAIHDHIDVSGVAADLLDTPIVQRLRRVRQLGTASLVYPSANHSRFEHSLGVYYLADEVAKHLDLNENHAECLRAAAILHDTGHGPFSHVTEPVFERHLGKDHDDIYNLLSNSQARDILENHGIDFEYISELVGGNEKYGQLIAGDLDVDRMDYLARDAHHTGVPYGTIDHEQLIRSLTFIDSQLVIKEGNIQAAENVLTARALMDPTVYHHHTARIAELMLLRATERLIKANELAPKDLRKIDDYDLITTLRSHPATTKMANRLDNRNLFKRAVWLETDAIPESLRGSSYQEITQFEREIAQAAGIGPETVLIDVPHKMGLPESETQIEKNGEVTLLRKQSQIIGALEGAVKNQRRLGIYTEESSISAVRDVADDVLDIKINGRYVKEREGDSDSLV
jgi:HD superfamily phosphohydrolase